MQLPRLRLRGFHIVLLIILAFFVLLVLADGPGMPFIPLWAFLMFVLLFVVAANATGGECERMVGEYVRGLIQELVDGEGYKEHVLWAWQLSPAAESPFGPVPASWRVYQVELEDLRGRLHPGWVRLGDGEIEMRIEEKAIKKKLLLEQAKNVNQGDSLWDPWLDG